MNSKSIFIGGVGRSGTTLIINLLNRHREIAAFGETKLSESKVFLNFPKWIYECPSRQRARLLDIFKQTCTTHLYCRLMFSGGNRREKAWSCYERLWLSRFKFHRSLIGHNPLWLMLERLWIPGLLQKLILAPKKPGRMKGSFRGSWRGLYVFLDKRDIKQCFVHLEPLKGITTLDEACRIYGEFWSYVFSTYAKKQKKKYWAEKTPYNSAHALFLKRCFSNSKFINLIRDGRDVACSFGLMWGCDIKQSLDIWAEMLTETLKDQAKMADSHYINIRYEDLVGRTRITLKEITDFLEIDFDETMLSLRARPASVGRYKREFNPELKDYAKQRYGPLLNRWGYPT